MNETEFLSKVSIFSNMKKEDLKRIAGQIRYEEFHGGEVIIHEGERDNRLFIVIQGEVEVVKDLGGKKEKVLGTFGPHGYFGEMALIDGLTRSASVVAREETKVLSLEQLDLRKEIEKSPAMAVELLQMLSRRVRVCDKFIIKTLGSILPICSGCKKVREDDGSWTSIEEYIEDRSGTEFSHGLCPECAKRLYPQYYKGD